MNNSSELNRQRTIIFSSEPGGQAQRALAFLSELPNCTAEPATDQNAILVSYNLLHHTLEQLESLLVEEGYSLDQSMLINIERNIIHYCEDTICHNMDVPSHPTKKNEKEVFIKAYEHQPHGDQDDTPPEVQEFK